MNKVGQIIRSARIEQNKSIEKISIDLKISRDVLEKFEKDEDLNDYDKVFYLGHLRSYCNYLSLDSELIANIYKRQISFNKNPVADKIPKPVLNNKIFKIQKFIPTALILIMFSSFYFLFINETKNEIDYALIPDIPEVYVPIIEKFDIDDNSNNTKLKDKNLTKNIEEINNLSAVAFDKVNEINEDDTITLKVLNPTWLQLRDEANNIILSQLMDKNDEYTYKMNSNYNITAGNAGNILVIFNKEVRGKIGKYGEVVDSIILNYNFNN